MSCCDQSTARVPDADISRRSLFKGAALIGKRHSGGAIQSRRGAGQADQACLLQPVAVRGAV